MTIRLLLGIAAVLLGVGRADAGDVLLGCSVGAKYDGTDYAANDTSIYLRGQRDLLLYKRQGEGAATFTVERRDRVDTRDGSTLACALRSYRMDDLLDDPGTPVDSVLQIGPVDSATIPLTDAKYPPGLYRFRVEPNRDAVIYQVRIDNLQYYAEEGWEPRYNPWFLGRDLDGGPIRRHFFVPAGADTVRLRLESSGYAKAQVIQETGAAAGDTLLSLATYGAHATRDSSAAFDAGTFTAAADDSCGQIYRIELSNPYDGRAGDHPVGDTWFRFSRNVPPYFAQDWRRLLVPVVHRRVDPVLYQGQRAQQSAYLCLQRSVLPAHARLEARIGEVRDTTSTGYRVTMAQVAPGAHRKLPVEAHLDSALGGGIARSTDKVDTVFVVQEPVWDTWDDPLYVMYDDRNGDDAAQIAAHSNYQTIQCDQGDKLEQNFGSQVQAMGALYSGDMDSVFSRFPDHPKVRFWMLADEPDRGPGPGGPVRRLRSIYSMYYAHKARPTSRMIALNVSHAYILEEYAEGADIIATDPYVKRRSVYAVEPRIVLDWAAELERITAGADSMKRSMVVLWAWAPGDSTTIVRPAQTYGDAWRLLMDSTRVDVVGTFKWGNATRTLTGFGAGRALWDGDGGGIETRWSELRE